MDPATTHRTPWKLHSYFNLIFFSPTNRLLGTKKNAKSRTVLAVVRGRWRRACHATPDTSYDNRGEGKRKKRAEIRQMGRKKQKNKTENRQNTENKKIKNEKKRTNCETSDAVIIVAVVGRTAKRQMR